MASSKETYCLCGQPYNIGQFMIECDCCREWFHGSCVDVKIYQSDDIDKYHCPKCAQTYGPSVLKVPTNNHRSDRYELGAEARGAQAGAPGWVRALAARPPRPLPAALMRMRGHDFTEQFVRDNGFTKPILFNSSEGLDIKVPNSATFTARSVLRYCGAQFEVEVIDVRKQATLRMPLGDFVEFFETPPDARAGKVLNLISLEFSDTSMSALVEPPQVARALDWSTRVWRALSPRAPRPAVAKYCLLSPGGAYTDWHVDFGGTTVWYHVLTGQKIFYLAPPTATNLALYQQWSASNNQSERFFGDMVEWYGTAEVAAGDTLVIPSGWLHAVLTPRDSLVFGGNFLHEYAIEMQLQIYEIERRVETPMIFRYPLFEAMNWYAGAHLLTLLRRHNEESQDEDFIVSEHDIQTPQSDLPPLLLRGIKLLTNALKEWHALKSTDAAKRDNVPKCLNSGQLVRELGKELRTLEKRTTTMANKDKDFKIKHTMTPMKAHNRKASQKKSLKLTLPKPIMHMAHLNGDYHEDKLYDKQFIETKDILYHHDSRFITQDIPQDMKYTEGLQEAKTFVVDGKELLLPTDKSYLYQNYEEHLPMYTQDSNGYVEAVDKKSDILRIKMDNSPSSSREAPPPYSPLPEHSILKSHLIGRPLDTPLEGALKQQWTISKKDSGEFHEQILFTNENVEQLPRQVPYGPGMYSADDIQPEYQYVVDTKQPYQTYSYLLPREPYHPEQRYMEQEAPETTPTQVPQAYAAPVQEAPAAGAYHELPSYDAAVAQQCASAAVVAPAHYEIEPPPAPRLRRSERPARRRVSPTYDYEDIDLYIDDAPATRRHRPSNSYRQPAPRPAPANGIESLIQASVLAEEEPPTATEDAAVAGMLSISEQRYAPQRTFGLAADTQQRAPSTSNSASPSTNGKRARAAPSTDDDDEEDVIKEVHRDDEYVYPSLEMSSDEDEEWTSSRRRNSRNRNDSKSKSDRDSSWSPRARLGRLVPRLRSGRAARRESVRAALHHARLHTVQQPPPQTNAKRAVLATKSKRPPPQAPPTPSKNNSRLKKGMKTAKQRLGKILKIHKMVY